MAQTDRQDDPPEPEFTPGRRFDRPREPANDDWAAPAAGLSFTGDGDGGDANGPGLEERHGAGGQARPGGNDVVDEDDPASGEWLGAMEMAVIGTQPEGAGDVHGPG